MNHEKVYDIIARNVDKTVDVIMILVVQAWHCGNTHKVSVKHLPAYWMTSRFNNRNLTTAKLGLAHAQKEGAEAQLALRKYIDDVNASRGPRMIVDHKAFVGAFRGKPKAKAEIWFAPNHEEAYEFALQIYRWLGGVNGDGAGWDVSEPKPIPDRGGDPKVSLQGQK